MKGKKQGSVIRSMNWEGKRYALYDFLTVEQEIKGVGKVICLP